MSRKKEKKNIQLFTDQGFEEGAIELLSRYEPGPVYILSTESPDGPGLYICDVPFTIEEADAQYAFVEDDALSDDSFDALDDAEPLGVDVDVDEDEDTY